MKFIEKIKNFFEKIFKKDKVEKLNAPSNLEEVEKQNNENIKKSETKEKKDNFIKSLKINIIKKSKKTETMECAGDGLGFKDNVKY